MPKLRRLSGKQVLRILEQLGFEVIRVRGSHHTLRRVVEGHKQTLRPIIVFHCQKHMMSLKAQWTIWQWYAPTATECCIAPNLG